MSRRARAPAPPLPPFERLDHTHAQMLRHLGQLAELVDRLDAQGADAIAREGARTLYDFFASTARRHHADEERHVFPPLLADGDAELVQHVLRLQEDHHWLEQDWAELAPMLQGVAEGYGGWDVDVMRHSVRVFAELYREHIALEETIVYPRARLRAGLVAAPAP
jgi:hemerythrin-like domain-containing protein